MLLDLLYEASCLGVKESMCLYGAQRPTRSCEAFDVVVCGETVGLLEIVRAIDAIRVAVGHCRGCHIVRESLRRNGSMEMPSGSK